MNEFVPSIAGSDSALLIPLNNKELSRQVYGEGGTFNLINQIIFTSLSTRSAGFAVVNNELLTPVNQLLFAILMVIGASPSSTGGGISVTVFAIVV